MVAIFTGLGAGFERGSGSTLGAMGVIGGAVLGRGGEQLFLNAANGNLMISNRDEFLVGSGPDAIIARTYNSQGGFDEDNGDGWRQSTSRRMTLHGTANATGSRVSRMSADGSQIFYDWNGSHYATTEGAGAHDRVTYASGVLTWTDGDSQMVEKYDMIAGTATFRIAQQTDTDGNTLTFSYRADGKLSRITTADGSAERNYIEYGWSGNNITQIDTAWIEYRNTLIIKTLTRTRYGYDGQNRLTSVTVDLSPDDKNVTDGKTYVTTYTYDGSSTRVQSISQSDGSKVEFGYEGFVSGGWVQGEPDTLDGSGSSQPEISEGEGDVAVAAPPPPPSNSVTYKVSSIRQWVDAVTSRLTMIEYDTGNRTTTITDPSGAQTRLTYDFGGQLTQIQQPALTGGAGQPVTEFEYNPTGDVIRVSRYRDLAQLAARNPASETRYDHDANGNTKQITDGLGNVVTRTYGARNELLSETSTIATGVTATTRYVYDAENHLRYVISPEGRVTEYRYRNDGEVSTTVEYPDHVFTYTPPTNPFVPVPPGTVANHSFETPEVGSNVVYRPTVSGMTFTGRSGIAGNGSFFSLPAASDGDQVAFLQGSSSSSLAISQSVSGLTAGATYELKFRLALGAGWMPVPVTVSFNGQTLGRFTPQSSSHFAEFTASFAAAGPSGTITFSYPSTGQEDMISDRVTGIDNVRVIGPPGPPAGPTEAELNLWRDSVANNATDRITHYSQDGRGLLGESSSFSVASLGFSESYSRTNYIYNQAGELLSRIVDGQIAETFTYDGMGRVVSSTDLNGARTNIVFDDAASKTVVSLANGYVKTSTYNRLGELISGIDSGHLAAPSSGFMTVASASFETPEVGNGSVQNAFADGMSFYGTSGIAGNGSSWNFAPAPDGDQVAYVQAMPGPTPVFEYRLSGLTVGAQYTVRFQIGASASRGGATVSLTFNGQSLGLFTPASTAFQEVTATFTATQSTGQLWFTGQGTAGTATAIDKVEVQLPAERGESYKYDSRGLLRTATDGTGVRSYFIHDRVGRKVADVNHLGEVIEYVYDALSRVVATARYANRLSAAQLAILADPQSAIDMASFRPAADPTDLWGWQVYDREGRLVEAIGGDGSVLSYEYDKSNRLIKTVAFAARLGAATVNGFKTAPPAAPVLPAADAAKDSVARNFYDKDGLLVGALDGEGYLSAIVYDKTGLAIEEIFFLNPSAAALRADGTFEQLLSNQPKSSGDRRTRYVYDGQGLLRYQVNALNELVGFNYNAASQLTSTVRYHESISEPSNFKYATIKAVAANLGSHADTRRDWMIYDGAGRVAYTIDAAGGVVRLFYDNVGQVSKTVHYEAGRATAALPTLADMDAWASAQALNAKNRTTRHFYDSTGAERFSVDPEGFVSGSEYDAEGRVVRSVRWKDKFAVGDADTLQTVEGLVRDRAFIDGRNIYDPAGRMSETVDGEGVKRRLDYNANGTLKWETVAFGTADARRTAFVYDNAGRVREQIIAQGTDDQAVIKFEYDGLGNLTKETDGLGNFSTMDYDRIGRVTKHTDPENNVSSFEFNAFGERTKMTDARVNSAVYAYDKLGRVISVTDAEGYVTETEYTEFGEIESVVRRETRGAPPAGSQAPAAAASSGQVRVGVGDNILANASFDQSGTFTATPVGRSNSTLPGWSKSTSQTFEQVSAGKFGVTGTDGAYWLDLESVVRAGRSPVGTNLVSNGSFELSGSYTATSTGRANATLPGWSKTNPEAFEQVQSGQLGVAASDGSYWLDLESVARTGVEIYGSNLVTNGSFEMSGAFVETATGRSNTTLPGWTKTNPETFEQVQSSQLGVRASDGLYWLDLDSVPTTNRTIVGPNLLVNGSFGQIGPYVVTATGRSSQTMTGWTKANPETWEQVASGQMGVTTHDGGFWLDLESIPTTGPQAIGPNLLVNGGFELSGTYDVVASGRANSTLPGWNKTNAEAFEQVETDATDIDGPIEGVYMLDLDSVATPVGLVEGPNLIVNGSFEQSAASYTTTGIGRYNELDIPGWTRLNAQGFEQLNSGYDGVAATDGSFYLDMEANGDAESRMDISQTIQGLAAGQQLSLKFDYANTAGMVPSTEEFENSGSLEVYWNGALVGRVSSHDPALMTKGFTLTSVEGDNILRFREIGVTDGHGVYLDNVRLNTTVTPPNLIINGSFEESAELWAENINGRINEGNIPGWVKSNSGMFEQINSGGFGTAATDGSFYLDMEGGGADSRMDISQTIRGLAAGKALTLKFDFANTAAANSGALEVHWNGVLIATINSQETVMSTKTFTVTSKNGDNKLRFREIGTQDGRGVSIDNVRLYDGNSTTVGGNMDIYQTVSNLTAGQVMQLQFNHARLTNSTSASFEVWWNQTLVATIADGKKSMQTNSYFVTAIQGDNKLRFKGTGTVDGRGAVIDDVRMFATQSPPNGGNMDISQTVSNLAAGQILELQFDHANRTSSASGSFEVWWNNALVSTITSTGTAMQTKSYRLEAIAGNNTVRFKSLGTVDAAGASLDNVRLFNTQPGPSGGNMTISQVIPNQVAGQLLQLKFDHANRTTSASGSFEVLWNGAVVATINSTGTTMQTKTYVVTAIAGSNTLQFRGLGDVDAAGASIDNVQLFLARPEPTGGNMAISQTVPNLAAGQVLQLQFDHANRTSSASGAFQVLWNGAVIATIDNSSTAMLTKTYEVTAIAGDNRLEFKALGTVDADGASIDNVRLFATQANLSGGNMVISQDVANLNEGQILELKFNHANRTTGASGSFEVVWNGSVVATIDSSDPVMQTKRFFVTAGAGTNRLEFRGLGTVDGEGASLDNVWLRATELRDIELHIETEVGDAITRFYYDRIGRVTSTRDAEDYVTETAYNRFGDATSVTRRANRTTSPEESVPTVEGSVKDAVTQFEYDQLGRLKMVTDAEGKSEVYELDAFGRRTALVNKLGGRTTFEYDNRGLLLSETLPITSLRSDGVAIPVVNKFEYDKRGNKTKAIEAFGLPEQRTTIFHYDKLNRLTKTEGMAVTVLDQNGHVTESTVTPTETVEYDDAGNVIAVVDALGTRKLFYYDRANRQKAELNADGLLTTFGYDGNGNLRSTKTYATPVAVPPVAGGRAPTPPTGEFRETTYEYDKLNRRTTTRIHNVKTGAWNGTNYALSTGDIVTTVEYDAYGNIIRSADANGASVYTYYDRLGRSTANVDQENYLTTWERDSEGNVLTERRAAQGAVWTATTDRPPTVASHADDRVTTFSYDRNGRRRFESRANVVSYGVDANGVLVDNPSKIATIEYRYNGLGMVTHKIEATRDTLVYDYDQEGRLVTETHQGYTDQADALVKPKVTYSYNGLDLLTQTRQGGETPGAGDRITLHEYVAGRLASTTDATGAKYSYAYDAAGNLLRESFMRQRVGAPSVEEAILYDRDIFGRIVSRTVAARSGATWAKGDSQDIAYNLLGEVAQRGTNKKWQEQYTYDNAGRLVSTNSGDGVWRFFVHDRNGNQTLALESEGTDLGGKSRDEVLAIATSGGSPEIGGAYVDGINASITVYDKRGMATETRLPHRELNAADKLTLILSRDFNAFGEVSAERDAKGALTNYTYNTMGRNLTISRPIVASTNESGVDSEAQPVETLYFDLSGRLVGSKDPNGHAITRHLLAGTGYGGTEALTITEFHADGGRIQNRYDVFGDLRVTINEVGRTARMTYDARGRMVRLDKAGGLVEHFDYDLLGQRIKHWNSLLGETDSETTEYDVQGRIRSQRAFGGDVTTTSYQWSADMVTAGMGTFGGWIETTTYDNGRQKIEHSDVFGRAVQKTDLGGHVFNMKYDKAARLVEQSGVETMTYSYLNSGLVGSVTTSRLHSGGFMEPWEATYGYDRNGNKVREQLKQNGALVQDASAEYDALNRLTLWTEAGTPTTPYSRVVYKYDANSNIRMIHADYVGLDGFGNMTGMNSKEHWYRFDSMNRVVVSKGVFGNNGIVAGPEGVEIGYNEAGERVRTLRSEQRMGQVYAPPPMNVHVRMPYTHEIVETYKYDDAGHLDKVFGSESSVSWNNGFIVNRPAEPGTLKADYDYDALGRLQSQKDYKDGWDVVYERTVTDYNAGGQIFKEYTVSKQEVPNQQTGAKEWTTFRTETKYYYGGETQTAEELQNERAIGPDALGGVVKVVNKNLRNGVLTHWSVSDTAYDWWDGAVQSVVALRADLWDPTKDSHTLFAYNAWGQLDKVNVNDGRRREVRFTNNLAGEAIRRDEQDNNGAGDPHEVWHRFNGRQMGYVGNNGTLNIDYQASINARTHYVGPSQGAFRLGDGNPTPHADFDQNYSALNSFEQGSAGGTYTVRAGDTLSSIAAQLWGDSSLWYKLAEANGLGSESGLADGQRLTIPVGVFKNHHNASTFMPFDPAAVAGDLSPTAPRPQAPVQKKNKCGVFGQILLIVVAVAVTFLTQGALAGPMTGLFNSALAGNIVAGGIAGAAGSIASQTVGVLTGIQERFDWKGVAMAGISGAVGGALGGWNAFGKTGLGKFTNLANDITRAAVASTITQGIGVATGLQGKFSWAAVAAAGVSAGLESFLGVKPVGKDNNSPGAYLGNLAAGTAGAIAGAATQSLIDGTDFGDNIVSGLAGVIGITIGNLIKVGVTTSRPKYVDSPMPVLPGGQGSFTEVAANNSVMLQDPNNPYNIRACTSEERCYPWEDFITRPETSPEYKAAVLERNRYWDIYGEYPSKEVLGLLLQSRYSTQVLPFPWVNPLTFVDPPPPAMGAGDEDIVVINSSAANGTSSLSEQEMKDIVNFLQNTAAPPPREDEFNFSGPGLGMLFGGNRLNGVGASRLIGELWERQVIRDVLPLTQTNIQPQVSIRSKGPSRKTTRLDAVGTDRTTGAIRLSDMKASETAPFTKNQRVVYPELPRYGGVVTGKGKPPYVGRTNIPPITVDIYRAEPGYGNNLRYFGRGARYLGPAGMVYGGYQDGSSIYNTYQADKLTGDYTNTVFETTRAGAGWGGAWVGGTFGAAYGAKVGAIGGPWGVAIGGVAGGGIGGGVGYWYGSEWVNDMRYGAQYRSGLRNVPLMPGTVSCTAPTPPRLPSPSRPYFRR